MTHATPHWISRNASPHGDQLVTKWLFGMALLVAIMVVIGGVTRLTGSGLSMVEWRPLIGTLPPLSVAEWDRVYKLYQASPEYQQLNFGMSLVAFKNIFFWEYFHRLWGRFLGLAFGLPFLIFVIFGHVPRGFGWRLTLLLCLGGFQGVVGWWMVKSGLTEQASVSQYRLASHLAVALVIFSVLIWTAFDLRDGRAKMSKSDPSDNSRINMTDDADMIMQKIRKAKTDPDALPSEMVGLADRPEASNLVGIYAALAECSTDDVLAEFGGRGFGDFKPALGDLAVATLSPIGAEMRRLLENPADIDATLADGAERAAAIARPVLAEVRDIVGFLGSSTDR